MSLGAYPEIRLQQARDRAVDARNTLNKGINPLEIRKAEKVTKTGSQVPIFKNFALEYIEVMRPKWRNPKHAEQWVNTIKSYAFPVIGELSLDQIDTPDILEILQPIWLTKPETASRLRGRLERILSAAITRKFRQHHNPAIWKGHLDTLMPSPPKSNHHHAALPYKELPVLMKELREMDDISALALEFTILTATRTGEVLGGMKTEIFDEVWTIPANRMKANKPHQVPLCQRALDILTIALTLDPGSPYLFSRNGRRLSSMALLMKIRRLRPGMTVHGFRSSFRDWVSEETDHSPEAAEMALAHTIGSKVEQAYRRGTLLERRKRLMNDWMAYCLGYQTAKVVHLRPVLQN
jgi:integrase